MIQLLVGVLDAAASFDDVLAEHAAEIRKLGLHVVSDMVEIGEGSANAKNSFAMAICCHGSSANSAGPNGPRATSSTSIAWPSRNREIPDLRIPLSAVYRLARASTPEEAVAEVLRRTEAGERVAVRRVKEIIGDARKRENGVAAETVGLAAAAETPSAERANVVDAGAGDTDLNRQAPHHRELVDALDALERMADQFGDIIATIPDAHCNATSARLGKIAKQLESFQATLDAARRRRSDGARNDHIRAASTSSTRDQPRI
jgi:hypothetical protein